MVTAPFDLPLARTATKAKQQVAGWVSLAAKGEIDLDWLDALASALQMAIQLFPRRELLREPPLLQQVRRPLRASQGILLPVRLRLLAGRLDRPTGSGRGQPRPA